MTPGCSQISAASGGLSEFRSVTWWPKAKPFLDYLARGSFLLQRGRFVADVLYYYMLLPKPVADEATEPVLVSS